VALTWRTTTDTISGFTASDPRVVMDSVGNATAVWIEKSTYSTGTCTQSSTTITGTGTTFTSDMVGGTIEYANLVKANITGFTSSTLLTTSQTLTVADQAYVIQYNGIVWTSNLPNGGSWGSAAQLSTTGHNSVTPRMNIDSNDIISVVWTETDTAPNTVIKYASYNGSWSGVTTLSTGTGVSAPSLAVDAAGNIVVVWTKSLQTEAIRKPISGAWSSITTFTTTNSDNASVATGGGYITVVWHAKPTTQDQIMASTTSTFSGSFSTPANIIGLANTGHMHNYPKVVVDSTGNSSAIWYRYDLAGTYGTDAINVFVIYVTLLAGASSWGLPAMASTSGRVNPADLATRFLCDKFGNTCALMMTSTYGNDFNIESNIRPTGGNLTGVYQLVGQNISAKDMGMSVSQLSNVLVVFMYFDGTNTVIQASETDIGGFLNPVTFTPPMTISATGTDNSHPRCGISVTGSTSNAVAVWESYDTTNNTVVIHAIAGSNALLGPPTDLIVTQIPNDYGVFTRFDNQLDWTLSTDPNATSYNLYRNGLPFVQVGSPTVQVIDTNMPEMGTGTTTTYSIASLDVNSQQSVRVNVAI